MRFKIVCSAMTFLALQAAAPVRADTVADMGACADERVKTEMLSLEQLVAAEASCSRIVNASPDGPDRQKALFFRGLVKFLQVVQAGAVPRFNADGSIQVYAPPTPQDVAPAMADVEAAMGLDGPLKGDALALRVTINQTIGMQDGIDADIEEALSTTPGNVTPLVQRALEAERRGDTGAAFADLNSALDLDPQAGTALMSRALLLRRIGELARAREDLAAAIALGHPFRRLALIEKSEVEARMGDLRAAFNDLLAATRETGDMPPDDVRDMNADLLVRAGDLALNSLKDPDTAEGLFNEAAILAPDEWYWMLGLGRVAEERGDTAKAIEIYQRILDGTTATPNLLERNNAAWRLRRLQQPLLQRRAGMFAPGFEFGVITEQPASDGLKRLAFVIGAGNYTELPSLPNARRDAAVVAGRLADMGFDEVEIAEDIGRANLIGLPAYIAERASETDIVVVFYAGHGVEVDGINYLIPVDATLDSEKHLNSTALELQTLTAAASKARRGALVIIDACRDDPFAETKSVVASRSISSEHRLVVPERIHMGLAPSPLPPPNNILLHSTQPGKTAADGDGLDSPFVIALLQTLSTPGLTLNEIVQETSSRVSDLTKGAQVPAAYGQLSSVPILPTKAP